MGFAFFKTPRHNVFEYKPRFYDEEKEKREQRRREAGLTDEAEDKGPGALLRSGAMRVRHNSFTQRSQSSRRRSQILLVLLIVGLSLVAYYMMQEFSDEFARIIFKK